jgi:hypothetical protein|tara:strand:- start:172 stop:519 length:348 start_codon:yes stop_codon:yes gene_type:complete
MWGGTPTRPKREIVKTTEKVSRVDKLNDYKKKRNKYYYELIKSIMDGAVSQCTSVVVLEPIKNHYPHYSYNSVVIYYDDDIHKMLLDDDIAAYADTSNNIVVTIDSQRVSQFKKK